MDAKLLKEFEDMEGLSSDALIDNDNLGDDNFEEEFNMKPMQASSLSQSEVFYEVRNSNFEILSLLIKGNLI